MAEVYNEQQEEKTLSPKNYSEKEIEKIKIELDKIIAEKFPSSKAVHIDFNNPEHLREFYEDEPNWIEGVHFHFPSSSDKECFEDPSKKIDPNTILIEYQIELAQKTKTCDTRGLSKREAFTLKKYLGSQYDTDLGTLFVKVREGEFEGSRHYFDYDENGNEIVYTVNFECKDNGGRYYYYDTEGINPFGSVMADHFKDIIKNLDSIYQSERFRGVTQQLEDLAEHTVEIPGGPEYTWQDLEPPTFRNMNDLETPLGWNLSQALFKVKNTVENQVKEGKHYSHDKIVTMLENIEEYGEPLDVFELSFMIDLLTKRNQEIQKEQKEKKVQDTAK